MTQRDRQITEAGTDPKALIDLPFAGIARDRLKRAGLWDEFADTDGPTRTFVVKATATVTCSASARVEIEARSEEEARHKFDRMPDWRVGWEIEDPTHDVDLEEVDVSDMGETPDPRQECLK